MQPNHTLNAILKHIIFKVFGHALYSDVVISNVTQCIRTVGLLLNTMNYIVVKVLVCIWTIILEFDWMHEKENERAQLLTNFQPLVYIISIIHWITVIFQNTIENGSSDCALYNFNHWFAAQCGFEFDGARIL